MTKKEMMEALAAKTGVSKSEVEKVFNATFELVSEEVQKEPVRVAGFGTFKLSKRAERVAKNPKTGEMVKVPAKNVVTFKPASSLKDSVK